VIIKNRNCILNTFNEGFSAFERDSHFENMRFFLLLSVSMVNTLSYNNEIILGFNSLSGPVGFEAFRFDPGHAQSSGLY